MSQSIGVFLAIPLICKECGDVLRLQPTQSGEDPVHTHDYDQGRRPKCPNFGKRYQVTDDLRILELS